MIHGVGVDIVRVARMREAVGRWRDRFLARVFTKMELDYCYKRKDPFLSLAVRFAAKEALIKAAGSGLPVSFTEIEVINRGDGKPDIVVSGRLRAFFDTAGIMNAHVSLSHEKEYGVACVVLEAR